jgi:hypothetical protein
MVPTMHEIVQGDKREFKFKAGSHGARTQYEALLQFGVLVLDLHDQSKNRANGIYDRHIAKSVSIHEFREIWKVIEVERKIRTIYCMRLMHRFFFYASSKMYHRTIDSGMNLPGHPIRLIGSFLGIKQEKENGLIFSDVTSEKIAQTLFETI